MSEVMLQQTQVERVIPYYKAFLTRFPTARALAQAPLGEVLRAWQGLGYNRRAKMLWQTAKLLEQEYDGTFPKDQEILRKLPGIGEYTAGAVVAFAYNTDTVMVETNIQTVVVHHLFKDKAEVSDKQIREALETLLPKGDARIWYWSLMDYGSHLKRTGVSTTTRQKGYKKQSAFKGSKREARGMVLRALMEGPQTRPSLLARIGKEHAAVLTGLLKEGLIEKTAMGFELPSARP